MVSRTCQIMGKYELKLFQVDENIGYEIKHLRKDLKVSSVVIGLNLRNFLRHAAMSEIIFQRFLQIDEKTLRVAYSGGLQGGGCCCSLTRKVEKPLTAQTHVEERLEGNQRIEMLIAKDVSDCISCGTMESVLIEQLKAIRPYYCTDPQGIAKMLLVSCKDNHFWSNIVYFDQRAVISLMICRLLIVSIIKNSGCLDFTEEIIGQLTKNLEEIRSRIEKNIEYPELSTVTNLGAIIKLLTQASSLQFCWNEVIAECPEILVSITSEQINTSLIKRIAMYYSTRPKKSNLHFVDFMLEIGIMENAIIQSMEASQEILEKFLLQKILSSDIMNWEEVMILLNFVTWCNDYTKVRADSILDLLSKFKTLMRNKIWEIREACVQALLALSSHAEKRVRMKAKELLRKMYEKEIRKDDKNEGIVNSLELLAERVQQSGKKKGINSNYVTRKIILGREDELRKIEHFLRGNRMVALVGEAGIGKSSIAIKYLRQNQFFFKLIWQINAESESTLHLGLTSLARKLQIQIQNNKDAMEYLKVKLSTCKDSILIIFYNAANEKQIMNYIVDNPKINYLATSRSQDWEYKIQIPQLAPEVSLAYQQILLRNSKEVEQIKILADRLAHWPLGLQQAAAVILRKNCLVKEFLEKLHESNAREVKKILLDQQFSNLDNATIRILQIISMCASQAIPEYMIKYLLLKRYEEEDWWKAKSRLVNCYIVSIAREFWSINSLIYKYIKKNYRLNELDEFTAFYCKEFVLSDKTWIDENRIKELRHLKPHLEIFTASIKCITVEEILLLYTLIRFYYKIEIHAEQANRYSEQLMNSISQATFDDKDAGLINSIMGDLFMQKECYDKSEVYYLNSLQMFEALSLSHLTIPSLYIKLGTMYKDKREFSKSENMYSQACQLQESFLSSSDPELATLYSHMGIMYKEKGDLFKSEKFYLKALKIQEEILVPNSLDIAILFRDLGKLHLDKEQYDTSTQLLVKALEILKAMFSPRHSSLAYVYMMLGQSSKSIELYLAALSIFEEILPSNHLNIANIYMNIANLYSKVSYTTKCREFYMKALSIFEEIAQPCPSLFLLYIDLAKTCNILKDYSQSELFYLKAFKIQEDFLPSSLPEINGSSKTKIRSYLFDNIDSYMNGNANLSTLFDRLGRFGEALKVDDQLSSKSNRNRIQEISEQAFIIQHSIRDLKNKELAKEIVNTIKKNVIDAGLINSAEEFIIGIFDAKTIGKRASIINLTRKVDKLLIDTIKDSLVDDCFNLTERDRKIKDQLATLIKKYSTIHREFYQRYMNTLIRVEKPIVDEVLFLAVCKFLDNLENQACLNEFITQIEKFMRNEKAYLTHRFLYLRLLPQDIQYIYAEIIMTINDPKKFAFIIRFIFQKLPFALDYKLLDTEWKENFISTALREPFYDTLTHFTNENILVHLRKATECIYLVDMPKKLFGITLKTQAISLKFFKEISGNQGATFIVYLHEMAHYLRRTNCSTISQACARKSEEHGEKEGGYKLEKMLFGNIVELITDEAGEFILSSNLSKQIENYKELRIEEPDPPLSNQQIFQKLFKIENKSSREKNSIELCRFGGKIYLGGCASVYGVFEGRWNN